jgi:hypothetical protein
MSEVEEVNIRQALRAQLTSPHGKVSRSAEGRRASEKAANNPRKSERGKTMQLNVEIREDLKGALASAAHEHRKKIWEIVEAGIEAELRRLGAARSADEACFSDAFKECEIIAPLCALAKRANSPTCEVLPRWRVSPHCVASAADPSRSGTSHVQTSADGC